MCPDCKNLNPKRKKKAKVKGTMYYCTRKHEWCTYPGNGKCPYYEKDKKRDKKLVGAIKKDLSNVDDMTVGFGLFFLFVITVLWIMSKIFD